MKTTQNVAKVSAQLIRAAVKDVEGSIVDGVLLPSREEQFDNATDSLREIAHQLEQYAGQENESPSLYREGLSGAVSTVQQAGDATSEGVKSSARSVPSKDHRTALATTQAARSTQV